MRQIFGSLGSLFAGACCLGLTPLLAGLTAIGAGFAINDAILIPLLLVFLGFTVWSLSTSRKKYQQNGPMYLGIAAALIAFSGLWIFAPLSYLGFILLISSSVWDMVLVRKCDTTCEVE